MKEISIVVPVYNVERYLRQCLESVLAQSFNDYEVILVDDGSTDNSGCICDEYARKTSLVHVIHQLNRGLSSARNAGLKKAEGQYLCFIDSDDVIDSIFCETLLKNAKQHNCLISACQMKSFKCDDEVGSVQRIESYSISEYSYMDFLKRQLEGAIAVGVCNKLFHRSLFQTSGFEEKRHHEDIFFAGALLGSYRGKVVSSDIPLYYYRQRDDSFMQIQQKTKKCHPDRILAADYLLQCCKKSQFPYMSTAMAYAVKYPWSFVDPIYVDRTFCENKTFLQELQYFLRKYKEDLLSSDSLDDIEKSRMKLFARNKGLYGINAYIRLMRVYLYRILKKDAYKDGHGI